MKEPENGGIVGWGRMVSAVHIRIDQWRQGDRRWFEASRAPVHGPFTWDELMIHAKEQFLGEPYLLVKVDQ